MIALLDMHDEDVSLLAKEYGQYVGRLCSPITRFAPGAMVGYPFAVDNGAYGAEGFRAASFEALLGRLEPHREKCLFVVAPDVVANARRTLECWPSWAERVRPFPPALVAQDGIEDLPIPWDDFETIFIGGSPGWKMSKDAADVIRAAKILGKSVHVGGVWTVERACHFHKLHADSIDGVRLAINRHQRTRLLKWLRDGDEAPLLTQAGANSAPQDEGAEHGCATRTT